MADVELVVKIPKEYYEQMKNTPFWWSGMKNCILNGTPLPKGHGRLIDADRIANELESLRDNWNYYGNEYEGGVYNGYDNALDEVMDAPTIIEADRSDEE